VTSYTTKGNYPYPDPTDAVTDYPAVASTFAGYVDNLPNRSRIINGCFDVWQRGATGTLATGSYTADRWRLDYDGAGGTRTVVPVGYGAGSTIGGMQPRFVPEVQLSNAGTSTSQRFGQRIEDVRTFAGETVTLSFWCLSTVAPKTIIAKAVQNFGTGGSPSANVTTTIGTATTTTSMVRKSYTFTMPSLSGKSIGTAENSYVEIHFEFGSQTGTFSIWGVQLEQNSTATALERRPIQQELELCQRYYERYTYADGGHFPQAPINVDSANRVEFMVFYKQKRAQPTISVSSATHLTFESPTAAGGQTGTGGFGALVGTGTRGANLFCSVTSWAVNNPAFCFISNSSGWIDFSAEL
jgi:hypothetical protein